MNGVQIRKEDPNIKIDLIDKHYKSMTISFKMEISLSIKFREFQVKDDT